MSGEKEGIRARDCYVTRERVKNRRVAVLQLTTSLLLLLSPAFALSRTCPFIEDGFRKGNGLSVKIR